MKTQLLACVGLAAFLATVSLEPDLLASECYAPKKLITSKVMVQVWFAGERFPGARVALSARGKEIGSGETDEQGFMEFVGTTPGTYRLEVRIQGFAMYQQDVQVVRSGLPPVLAAVTPAFSFSCAYFCPVTTSVPLKEQPCTLK